MLNKYNYLPPVSWMQFLQILAAVALPLPGTYMHTFACVLALVQAQNRILQCKQSWEFSPLASQYAKAADALLPAGGLTSQSTHPLAL